MQSPMPDAVQKIAAARATDAVDSSQEVTLAGNVHPLARAEFDAGPADVQTPMDRMVLLLQPTAQRRAELDALVHAQQDRASRLYHHWLTPAEYGTRFGASAQDVARVTAWLASHGFAVVEIPEGNRLVVFSGTAGQVEDAFHTDMRRYRVGGVMHVANAQDPQIPAALRNVVDGVVSLNDFHHHSDIAARTPMNEPADAKPRPLYSAGSTHYLFPADFAAIYDLAPLYAAGTQGRGVSIAIAGRSNINPSDIAAFRSLAGLAANAPAVIVAARDPGLVADDQDESTLDVEWAGAVAPAADVSLVVAASTLATDGVDLAALYTVNHATANVVSVSYNSCEEEMGAAELAFYNALWEQAASQGMSVFVASGDAGAADCSLPSAATAARRGVNGICSSPYATCVGGTDLNEGAHPEQYWSAGNTASYGSALGYIPEVVWNESAANGGSGLWASGGGVSAVYVQPGWQAAVADGMRSLPDIAFPAASHDGYVVVENGTNWIFAGTSAAAPAFAGVMALVVDRMGGTGQGSANPRLYALAGTDPNVFHATLAGNNTVPGVTGFWANGAAYNLATGLGSVDGAALVASWDPDATEPPMLSLTADSSAISIVQGGSATVNFTLATGGAFSGDVTLSIGGLQPGMIASWSPTPTATMTGASTRTVTLTLTASARAAQGDSSLSVTAAGDGLTATQAFAVKAMPPRICLRSLSSACGALRPALPQPPQQLRRHTDQNRQKSEVAD